MAGPLIADTGGLLTIDHADFGPLRVGQRFTQRLEIVP
jgi:hypothetical protein